MSGSVHRKSLDSIGTKGYVPLQKHPVHLGAFQASLAVLPRSSFQPGDFKKNVLESLHLPFREHLRELRNRIFSFFATIILGSMVAYYYHDQLVTIITKPLNQSLFYSSPGGGFDFLLKLSLLSGLLLAVPVFIYHLLRFLEPLFSRQSRFLIIGTVTASYALLLAGATFAYWVALPLAIGFLSDFASSQVQSMILTTEYLSFLMAYLLGFGLAFQLPIILWVVNFIHPFKKGQLWRNQKWVVLLSFIVAAIVTPTPDLFNMLIMALPIILLYQVSVILVWVKNRRVWAGQN